MDYSENITDSECNLEKYYFSNRQETLGIPPVYATSNINRSAQVEEFEKMEHGPIERQDHREVAELQGKISEFTEQDTVVHITGSKGYPGSFGQILKLESQEGPPNDASDIWKEAKLHEKPHGVVHNDHLITCKSENHSLQEEILDSKVLYGLTESGHTEISALSECDDQMEISKAFWSAGKRNRFTDNVPVKGECPTGSVNSNVVFVEAKKDDNQNKIDTFFGVEARRQPVMENPESSERTYKRKTSTHVGCFNKSVDLAAIPEKRNYQSESAEEIEIWSGIFDNASSQNEQAKDVQFASELADYERDFLAYVARSDVATSRFVEKHFLSQKFVAPLELSECIESPETPVVGTVENVVESPEELECWTGDSVMIKTCDPAKAVAALKKTPNQNGPDILFETVEGAGKVVTDSAIESTPVFSTAASNASVEERPSVPCESLQNCLLDYVSKRIEEYRQLPSEKITKKHIKRIKKWHKMIDSGDRVKITQELERLNINLSSKTVSNGSQTVVGAALKHVPTDIITKEQRKDARKKISRRKRFGNISYNQKAASREASSIEESIIKSGTNGLLEEAHTNISSLKGKTFIDEATTVGILADTSLMLRVTEPFEQLTNCIGNVSKFSEEYAISSAEPANTCSQPFSPEELENCIEHMLKPRADASTGDVNSSSKTSNISVSANTKELGNSAVEVHYPVDASLISTAAKLADSVGLLPELGTGGASQFKQNKANLTSTAVVSEGTKKSGKTSFTEGESSPTRVSAHIPVPVTARSIPRHIAIRIEELKQLPLEKITRKHIRLMKRWNKAETWNDVLSAHKMNNLSTNRAPDNDDPSGDVLHDPQIPGVPFIPPFILDKLEELKRLPLDVLTERQREAVDKWQKLLYAKNRLENLHMVNIKEIKSQSMKRPQAEDTDAMKHVSKKTRTELFETVTGTLVETSRVVDGISTLPASDHPKKSSMEYIHKKRNKLKLNPPKETKFVQPRTKSDSIIYHDAYRGLSASTSKILVSTVSEPINICGENSQSSSSAEANHLCGGLTRTSPGCVSNKPTEKCSHIDVSNLDGPLQGLGGCVEKLSKKEAVSFCKGSSAIPISAKSSDTSPQLGPVEAEEPLRKLEVCIENLSKPTEDVTNSERASVESISADGPVQESNTSIENISRPTNDTSTSDETSSVDKLTEFVSTEPSGIPSHSKLLTATESIVNASSLAGRSAAPSFSELAAQHGQFCFVKEIELPQGETSHIANIPNAVQNKFDQNVATIVEEGITKLPECGSGKVPSSNIGASVVPVSAKPPDALSKFGFVEAARQLQAARGSADAITPTIAKAECCAKPLVVSDEMVRTPFQEISTCADKASRSAAITSETKSITTKKIAATNVANQKENQVRKRRHDADTDGPGDIKRQRTKAPLCPYRVAVVDKGYPEVILTRDQSDEIENELAYRLEQAARLDASAIYQFNNCSYAGGVLWICCEDERTKVWLKGNVARLSSFWRGLRLKAVDEADLPLRPKVMVAIPNHEPDVKEFLAGLDGENLGLTASNWHLIGKKSEKGGGVIFAFTIDNNSYAMLENNNWQVSYMHTTILCKIINKISDMWEHTSDGAGPSRTSNLKDRESNDKGYPLSWRNAHLKQSRKNERFGNVCSSSHSVQLPYAGFLKF